jgi:hypothetical protein
MSYTTYQFDTPQLSLPITESILQKAQAFAAQQPTANKAEQVRQNAIAVQVMQQYLMWMDVETQLDRGDSWNPLMQLCANVADLEITGKGRLECRPVAVEDAACYVPPEVWGDRLGYVMVQLDLSAQEATILGFLPEVEDEWVSRESLQPIESLFDYLAAEQTAIAPSVQPLADQASQVMTRLSQWMQDQIDAAWQTVESVLQPTEMTFAFRDMPTLDRTGDRSMLSIRRAKRVDQALNLPHHPIALVVDVQLGEGQSANIRLQLYPAGMQRYLPPQVHLVVLDEAGETFLQAVSEDENDYIQLQLTGQVGERFAVRAIYQDSSVMEQFII